MKPPATIRPESRYSISLRTILIFLVLVPLAASSLAIGFFSYRNAVTTVNELARQLCSELISNVDHRFDDYLDKAWSLNASTSYNIRQGLLDPENLEQLTRYFWDEGQIFPGLGSIGFGNTKGELAGADEPRHYLVAAGRKLTKGSIRRYAPTPEGGMSDHILFEKEGYDARTRSWYKDAVLAGKAIWAGFTISVPGSRLDLTAASPVYNRQGTLLGVAFVDVSLTKLTEFLHHMQVGKSGQIFIMEKDQAIVASSYQEAPYLIEGGQSGGVRRLFASASKSPQITRAIALLLGKYPELKALNEGSFFSGTIHGEQYFVQASPYRKNGLDLLMVVVVPQSDFTKHIQANNTLALLLAGFILLAAIGFGIIAANRVSQPIQKLNLMANNIGSGVWPQGKVPDSSVEEVKTLAESFREMSEQLRDSMQKLRQEIEERKKVESSLQATLTVAQEEREKTRAIIAGIGDGISIQDRDFVVLYQNEILKEFVGEHENEYCYQAYHNRDSICEDCPIAKCFADSKIHTKFASHLAPEGTRHMAITASPLKNGAGEIIGGIELVKDVTDISRLKEEQLKVKKLESIGVLAGGIAHDFNNILAAILGNIELALLTAPSLTSANRKTLETAGKAAIRARELTQQLLTFAKGGEPIRQTASLVEVVKDSADFVLRGGRVACHYHFPDELWLVDIDKSQISQVVQNIILNAGQAMPEGGTIRVLGENVTAAGKPDPDLPKTGNFVKLSIEDHGLGIPPNVIDRIFDPYFTTKREGSGLGLAITFSIIDKHGGHISVKSTPGVGTIFLIYLPAATEQAPAAIAETETPKSDQLRARIMVMDDEKLLRDMSRDMLKNFGHQTVLARDGEEAISLYKQGLETGSTIDLVIMDLTIPGGMGGKKAVKEILALDPRARVIVTSGYSTDPIMANYSRYGFCGALVKPYEFKDLLKLIRERLKSGETG
jgi:signal transduction histidine kinase/ActR/RegA family two-component response regulator/HAMP domain-containing protein